MRRMHGIILALSLVALPGALAAQTPDTARSQAEARRERLDPIGRLLAHREELGLTADQVKRLEEIQADLRERNRPLLERVEAARAEWAERRQELRAESREEFRAQRRQRVEEARKRMEELRPTLEQLRENQREALEEAEEVLTDEQKARLKELREQWRAELRERGRAARPRPGPGMRRLERGSERSGQ
jgi:DNA repair exonuclease SbcCD ATPase subunit